MKSLCRWILFFLCLCAADRCMADVPRVGTERPARPIERVHVLAVDSDGTPVAFATVRLVDLDGAVFFSGQTQRCGWVVFDLPRGESCRIVVLGDLLGRGCAETRWLCIPEFGGIVVAVIDLARLGGGE